jgi:hypothetical protein
MSSKPTKTINSAGSSQILGNTSTSISSTNIKVPEEILIHTRSMVNENFETITPRKFIDLITFNFNSSIGRNRKFIRKASEKLPKSRNAGELTNMERQQLIRDLEAFTTAFDKYVLSVGALFEGICSSRRTFLASMERQAYGSQGASRQWREIACSEPPLPLSVQNQGYRRAGCGELVYESDLMLARRVPPLSVENVLNSLHEKIRRRFISLKESSRKTLAAPSQWTRFTEHQLKICGEQVNQQAQQRSGTRFNGFLQTLERHQVKLENEMKGIENVLGQQPDEEALSHSLAALRDIRQRSEIMNSQAENSSQSQSNLSASDRRILQELDRLGQVVTGSMDPCIKYSSNETSNQKTISHLRQKTESLKPKIKQSMDRINQMLNQRDDRRLVRENVPVQPQPTRQENGAVEPRALEMFHTFIQQRNIEVRRRGNWITRVGREVDLLERNVDQRQRRINEAVGILRNNQMPWYRHFGAFQVMLLSMFGFLFTLYLATSQRFFFLINGFQ